MHEVGLVADAIAHAERVAREASARRIERLTFALIVGGHVTVDAVETLFVALSRGTMAEGAAVLIEELSAPCACPDCGPDTDDTRVSTPASCLTCGQECIHDVYGPELMLRSIDVSD